MISGARRVELLVIAEGWMAVCADADWITPSLVERKDPSMESAFSKMIPLAGGRPNQIRFEVFVAAFSSRVSVKEGKRWIPIMGDLPPQEVRGNVERNEFAVLFEPQLNS